MKFVNNTKRRNMSIFYLNGGDQESLGETEGVLVLINTVGSDKRCRLALAE